MKLGKSALKFSTPLVIAGALFLAGCGGSDAPTPPPPVVELSDAEKAVNAASAAVGGITAASTRDEVSAAGAAIATARDEIGKLAYAERAAHTTVVDGLAETLDLADRLDAIDKIAAANSLAGMDPVNIAGLDAAIMAAKAAIANVPDSHQAAYTAQLGGSETALSTAIAAREAMELADRRTAQMLDLTNASESLQTALAALSGATPTQALLDAANTALAALNSALDGAADLTATETATYQSQADNAVSPIAMAQGRFDESERMRLAQEEQDRIDNVVEGVQMDIDSAMEAVDGLTVSSSDTEVEAAETAIATAKASIEAADIPEDNKVTLRANLALEEGALRGKKSAIMAHRDSAEEQQRIAGIVETLEGDIADANTAVDGLTNSSSDADVAAAEAAIEAAEAAIEAADIPDANKATLRAKLEMSDTMLTAKMTGINSHRQAMAMKLHGGIGATPLDTTTRTTAYATDDIAVSIDGGTTTVNLSEDEDVMVDAFKGWEGMRFTAEPDADDAGTYEAVVYSHVGEGTTTEGEMFSTAYTLDATTGETANVTTLTGYATSRVASTSFDQSAGTKAFIPGSNDVRVMVAGSYHGVAGTYYCTPADRAVGCTAAVADMGFTLAGGTWTFKPTNPETRLMDTTVPDANYASYGWWIHTSEDGNTVTVSAFDVYKGTDPGTVGIADLRGTATYSGGAAGKYALHSNTGGTNDSGHFTADATLEATFGEDHKITGTIDEFIGADGASRDWSVTLNASTVSDTGGIAGDPETAGNTDNQMTVWTIGDTAADAGGQWSGDLREQGDDGVPAIATGTFHSIYGTSGSMVGAFGANEE